MTNNGIFDAVTRIGEDNCAMSQDNIQNAQSSTYMTQNYFLSQCGMKQPIAFATSQPAIVYNGGLGMSVGGCNVNESSNLLIGSIQTNPKCRLNLQERPFATIPYLGRGPCNAVLEAELQQGDQITNKKSITTTSEKCYLPYSNYPLIDPIKETITNPEYLVEGAAAQGWVRGGVPSRDLVREKQYANDQTKNQYA